MLVNSAIWLITLTLIAFQNIENIVKWVKEIADGEKRFIWLLLIDLSVVALCVFGFCKHISNIKNYEKHPKVATMQEPKIDTLNMPGRTYYLYDFQDNYYKDIKKLDIK